MLWLIIGLLIGAGVVYLIFSKRKVTWYQWVLGAISVFLLLFCLQNFLGFRTEMEPYAANFILLTVGVPGLLIGALAVFLPRLFKKREKASTATQ